MPQRPVMQSLQNGLIVLSLIGRANGPVSMSYLRNETGLTSSTLSRLLTALAEQGYVRKVPGRLFALDHAALILGGQALLNNSLVHFGRRFADELSRTLGRPAYIGTVWKGRSLVLYQTWVHVQPDGYAFGRIGERPLHNSSIGKVMIAYGHPEASQDSTDMSLGERDAWLLELERVREQGYATADGEQESLAVPLKDESGGVVAALATEAPEADDVLAQLLATASRISAAIGYRATDLDNRVTGRMP